MDKSDTSNNILQTKSYTISHTFANTVPNTVWLNKDLYTRNLTPKKRFFDEKVRVINNAEFRYWDPRRSKLCAALRKKVKIDLREGDKVLYLGASHGYTPSFMSDIIGDKGFLLGIDFAPLVVRDLVKLCELRNNMAPLLGDCNHPKDYENYLIEFDVLFQDIAQKNQPEIFLKHLQYIKRGGLLLLALKARSVNVTLPPNQIFDQVEKQLKKEVDVMQRVSLEPFEEDHAFFVCRKR
ncbi:fibrillarin-like rRNA/tRNA 2'-O-methyltransferase [Candidatus Woesearchaeota archaeon]|nr:fibrillarin-like rRNA/tRNA 2'-O-methyltransferase [Candidatus Woesearchaeota archaeon]